MKATMKEINQTYILKLGEDFDENDLEDWYGDGKRYLNLEFIEGILRETGYLHVSNYTELNKNNEIEITLLKRE